MIAALIVLALSAMPLDLDQYCEDQTDVMELSELPPECVAWVMEGDTCAESDQGCPSLEKSQ